MLVRKTMVAAIAILFVAAITPAQVLQIEQVVRDWDYDGVDSVVFSPDGRHAYYTSNYGLLFFEVDANNGNRTLIDIYGSEDSPPPTISVNPSSKLWISQDGKFLYATSPSCFTFRYKRNTVTGELFERRTIHVVDSSSDIPDCGYYTELGTSGRGIFTPYTGGNPGIVYREYYRFERNPLNGFITVGAPYTFQTRPKSADSSAQNTLHHVFALVSSPDGRDIYVIQLGSVNHYQFDEIEDDYLHVETYLQDGAIEALETKVALDLAISPDGRFVYVGHQDSGVIVLSRDTGTGELSYLDTELPSVLAHRLRISADGERLVAARYRGVALAEVNTTTGELALLDVLEDSEVEPQTNPSLRSGINASPDLRTIHTLPLYHSELRLNEDRTEIRLAAQLFEESRRRVLNKPRGMLSESGDMLHVWDAVRYYVPFARDEVTGLLTRGTDVDFGVGRKFLGASADATHFVVAHESTDTGYLLQLDSGAVTELCSFPLNLQSPEYAAFTSDLSGFYIIYQVYNHSTNKYDSSLESYTWDGSSPVAASVAAVPVVESRPERLYTLGDDIHFASSEGYLFVRDAGSGVLAEQTDASGDPVSIFQNSRYPEAPIRISLQPDLAGGFAYIRLREALWVAGFTMATPGNAIYQNDTNWYQSRNGRDGGFAATADGRVVIVDTSNASHVFSSRGDSTFVLSQLIDKRRGDWPHRVFENSDDIVFSPQGDFVYFLDSGVIVASVHDPVSMSGTIRSATTGAPILASIAFISASEVFDGVPGSAFVSDYSGEYRVSGLNPSEYVISVQAPGFEPFVDSIIFAGQKSARLDFDLEPSVSTPLVSGIVVGANSGLPVVGHVFETSDGDVLHTNAHGEFELYGPVAGGNSTTLKFDEGYFEPQSIAIGSILASGTDPYIVELTHTRKNAQIVGTVTSDGSPAAGALVIADGPVDYSTVADANGEFVLAPIASATTVLSASAPGHDGDRRTINLFSGGGTAVELEIEPQAPAVLAVAPLEISFPFEGGTEAATVENAGGGFLQWEGQFVPEADWVTVEVSKQFTQGILSLTAAANIYGKYESRSTNYFIESATATNSPQVISIIQEAPPLLTDLDGMDGVNAVDIQLIINRLLALPGASGNGDVNNDGKQDATDLQLVINAALGI